MSTPTAIGFSSLGLDDRLLQAVADLGYEEPSPIQREAIPLLLAGRDVLGRAATGTGKTAAFSLPLLQRIEIGGAKPFEASALVLVPTRELAVQVAEALHKYGKPLGVTVLPIYGGQEISHQFRQLKRGVDVVVATPGRALDHMRRKTLKLEKVSVVVLDEADEMLDMGFAEDLESILGTLPASRQTALFSATLPPRIARIAEQHLTKPARLHIREEKPVAGAAPKVRQVAYVVPRGQKSSALGRLFDLEAPKNAIVFCRTRTEVDALTDTLKATGFAAEGLHGGMTQAQRARVLKRFKDGAAQFLVATDVAARGLHIDKLSHVVNYDLPTAPEAYVHRIGRTGRAGEEGVAISLAEPREHRLLKNIERVTGQPIAMERLPTVADLRARQLELLTASLREQVLAGDLDPYRVVVESLANELDLLDIAAAAVKLSQAGKDAMVQEAPPVEPPRTRAPRERAPKPRRSEGEMVKLFIGAGRRAGIRPADLVGAIANEADVESSVIGSIQIADAHSVVEVPAELLDRVQEALRKTTLRGRSVKVHRYRAK